MKHPVGSQIGRLVQLMWGEFDSKDFSYLFIVVTAMWTLHTSSPLLYKVSFPTFVCNTSRQHSSPELVYNTLLRHFFYHFSTTLPRNLLRHSPLSNTTTPFPNTSLQHCSTTLLYNSTISTTSPRHFCVSATLFYKNPSLHHFSTTLFSNVCLQYFSSTLFSNPSLKRSSPTPLYITACGNTQALVPRACNPRKISDEFSCDSCPHTFTLFLASFEFVLYKAMLASLDGVVGMYYLDASARLGSLCLLRVSFGFAGSFLLISRSCFLTLSSTETS